VEKYDRDGDATDTNITWHRKDVNFTRGNQGGTADTLAMLSVTGNSK
jgi:hypothetical protein